MFVRHPRLSDHRLGTDPFIRQTQVGIRNCMPKCRRAAGQRGYAIAPAVGLVTEKLAASQDELPFDNRLIVSNPGRISDRTNAKPVGAPFLDFPAHVEQSVRIGCEGINWCGHVESVANRVFVRKLALPDIAEDTPVIIRFRISPRIPRINTVAARRVFPFWFGWRPSSDPGRVGCGISMGYMGDRVIFWCPVSRKVGGTTPVGLVNSVPPWQVAGTGTGRIFQRHSEHV